ncbi:CMRF35-like molecule 8 isoform X1 [Acipenser ruthenus]|uniref:CMRF35-like molecule 8 isoform X1 n=2 Tax=Acipenser ruthenus TaxID=7906 RepID=UPI00145B5904|nr:CMRF35-like molecule 8 isoform X1 [Acipenser ruthenus]
MFSQVSDSLHLWADQTQEIGTVGGSLTIVCRYDRGKYVFFKKYWCHGESRNWCDTLIDTDGSVKTNYNGRISIWDNRRGLLSIEMKQLSLEDTGTYWCGIDKPYADIMCAIHVKIVEEPVSDPVVTFLSLPSVSCSTLTISCHSAKGTSVHYTWYKSSDSEDVPVQLSHALSLHCETLLESQQLYCTASNSVSKKSSVLVGVDVILPAQEKCVFRVKITNQESYTCWNGITTSTVLGTYDITEEYTSRSSSLSTGVIKNPPDATAWYITWEVVRWMLFATLLVVCIVMRQC